MRRTARTYVREFVTLQVPEVPEELLYDIQLVTSELVTNAYRYGTEPGDFLLVALTATPGRVRIEVHDPCRRRPRARAASFGRERGRGLILVSTLATDWGVADRPMGKVVWAEHVWPVRG
ncbi:ATP-binding protein [Streptomyces sp. NPDC059989]|uniref:ATP-binding protein n=1 Tax=Streptomyces sp. NPDC059989 TaxID=3347026 RepID=UPI0036794500